MATLEELTQLRRLIEKARQDAIQLNEKTTAFILAMAELEIAENIADRKRKT